MCLVTQFAQFVVSFTLLQTFELHYFIKVLYLDYWQKYVGAWIAYSITNVLFPAADQFQSGSRHVTGVGGLCRSFHETSFRHLGEMAHHFPSIPISIT